MDSGYVIQETEKSRCSKCNSLVFLLSNFDEADEKPAFYICFKCQNVSQVGVGHVQLLIPDGG